MNSLRTFSALAVTALLVSSPRVWAVHATVSLNSLLNNTKTQNSLSNNTISDNNNKQNTVRTNNPTLNIPSGNAQGNFDAQVTEGFGSVQNTQTNTVSVFTLAGTLTVDLGNGKTVTINPGQGTVIDVASKQTVKDANGNEVRSLKTMLDSSSAADKQALIAGLTASVQRHAQMAVDNKDAAQTKELVTETAFMMKVLAQTVPAETLNTIMTVAVTTLTKANSLTGGATTDTAVSALIEGAKQGGASQDSMIAAANTGAQSNGKSFAATNLQTATVVNTVLTTTPVDVSLVSPGGE